MNGQLKKIFEVISKAFSASECEGQTTGYYSNGFDTRKPIRAAIPPKDVLKPRDWIIERIEALKTAFEGLSQFLTEYDYSNEYSNEKVILRTSQVQAGGILRATQIQTNLTIFHKGLLTLWDEQPGIARIIQYDGEIKVINAKEIFLPNGQIPMQAWDKALTCIQKPQALADMVDDRTFDREIQGLTHLAKNELNQIASLPGELSMLVRETDHYKTNIAGIIQLGQNIHNSTASVNYLTQDM